MFSTSSKSRGKESRKIGSSKSHQTEDRVRRKAGPECEETKDHETESQDTESQGIESQCDRMTIEGKRQDLKKENAIQRVHTQKVKGR